jgi:hypothetical protein
MNLPASPARQLVPQAMIFTCRKRANSAGAISISSRKMRPVSMYARCITRGVLGSLLPVMYGNGTEIVQTPGLVAIHYEMIHEARIIPLDAPGQPNRHLPAAVRTYMGDPRGHREGNTYEATVDDPKTFTGA